MSAVRQIPPSSSCPHLAEDVARLRIYQACDDACFLVAGAFVYDVEEDKLNEAGVRAAVWDEMTFYHPEALNMKRL